MTALDSEVLNLARQNRERYLCALSAPSAVRPHLLALAAYLSELSRLGTKTSEPMLGRIRLQWWVDVLPGVTGGRAPSHPIAGALAQSGFSLNTLRALTEAHGYLFEEGPASLAEIAAFGEAVGENAATLSCDALCVTSTHERDAAKAFSTALVLLDTVDWPMRELSEGVEDQVRELAREKLDFGAHVSGSKQARPMLVLSRLVRRRLRLGPQANAGAGGVLSVWWGALSGRL